MAPSVGAGRGVRLTPEVSYLLSCSSQSSYWTTLGGAGAAGGYGTLLTELELLPSHISVNGSYEHVIRYAEGRESEWRPETFCDFHTSPCSWVESFRAPSLQHGLTRTRSTPTKTTSKRCAPRLSMAKTCLPFPLCRVKI